MKERYVEIKRKSGVLRTDLRSWVEKLQLKGDASLEMVLKMRREKTVRPYEVLKGVLELDEVEGRKVSVLKTKVYFKESPLMIGETC